MIYDICSDISQIDGAIGLYQLIIGLGYFLSKRVVVIYTSFSVRF